MFDHCSAYNYIGFASNFCTTPKYSSFTYGFNEPLRNSGHSFQVREHCNGKTSFQVREHCSGNTPSSHNQKFKVHKHYSGHQ